jgi:hypothetical protein
VTTVSTATTSPEACLRAPAEPLTAVLDSDPFTTMPLDSPAARFAVPRPMSSRFGLIWYPSRESYVFAAPRPSANPTSMTPTAGPASLR